MSDMVDEKDEKKAEPPAPPPPPARPRAPVWPKIMKVWVALMGLSWGATIAHALSLVSWLGSATIPSGREKFSAGALAAGAVLAIAIIFLANKKFGKSLGWAKPGQGAWVRISALVALGALTVFGCTAFYILPTSTSTWWGNVLYQNDFFGKALSIRPILFPTAGILTTVMLVIFLLLNQEKWAEFLIETEGELKKVSWPARKEYVGSAAVVVLVVAIISLFLFFVDRGFSSLFAYLSIGF
jgi:preprotein translocase SecE subunit